MIPFKSQICFMEEQAASANKQNAEKRAVATLEGRATPPIHVTSKVHKTSYFFCLITLCLHRIFYLASARKFVIVVAKRCRFWRGSLYREPTVMLREAKHLFFFCKTPPLGLFGPTSSPTVAQGLQGTGVSFSKRDSSLRSE